MHGTFVCQVQTEDFGGLSGLSFGSFVAGLYPAGGWREGLNMFGAPFDWRNINEGLLPYYGNLKDLVEKAYMTNNKTRVSIVAPSYGSPVMQGFFARMSQAWKDEYIGWYIADSPL